MEYLECEKMKKVQEQSQKIGEFLEWLDSQGMLLCKLHKHTDGCYDEDDEGQERSKCGLSSETFYPLHRPIEQILAEYFNIDLNKIDIEKRAMLEETRKK